MVAESVTAGTRVFTVSEAAVGICAVAALLIVGALALGSETLGVAQSECF